MPRKIDVAPGSSVTVQNDDRIRLLPGTHRALQFAAKGVEVFGAEDPASSIIDAKCGEFAIRGLDGSDGAHVHTLTLRNAGHGIRITEAADVTVEDVISEGHAVEGFHFSGVPDLRARRLLARNLGLWRFQTYDEDRSHALYLAGQSPGAIIEDLEGENCGGSLIQANASSTQHVIEGLVARRLLGRTCGRGGSGTLAFAFMGVRGALIELVRLEKCNGVATFFSDNQGAAFACFDNTLRDFTLANTPNALRQIEGSARNTFSLGEPWDSMPAAPGAPTPASPSPAPVPGPESEVVALRARVEAAESEADRLRRQIIAAREVLAG